MIVLGIDTATSQTSVALGTERGVLAEVVLAGGRPQHDAVAPAVEQILRWSGTDVAHIGGVAVGIGPGLFTGLRVGVQTAKTLAQVLHIPIAGLPSLDAIAFRARHSRRVIAAVTDARRQEVFFAIYRPTPGGLERVGEYAVGPPDRVVAEIEALGEEALLVGDGAIRFRRELAAGLGSQVEFGPASLAYPAASALVELAIPMFHREEFDRVVDVMPLYLRKSDAEIAWDRRARTG